jgi:hypothetical protein
VVLASNWAAVAPTQPGAESIANDLDGAVMVDFTADGPPVSYSYPSDGSCREG